MLSRTEPVPGRTNLSLVTLFKGLGCSDRDLNNHHLSQKKQALGIFSPMSVFLAWELQKDSIFITSGQYPNNLPERNCHVSCYETL